MTLISLTMLLLFISLVLVASVNGQQSCGGNNYTTGSIYQSNLNTLLSSLYTNVDQTGFYNASLGEDPDRVYVLVLCRGDLQLDTCRSCVQNATVGLVSRCPNQRQASYWEPLCMLRYSDESMFGTIETRPYYRAFRPENVSNPDAFNADLSILLPILWGQAAEGGPRRKVAAGNRTTSAFQYIYALAQCTPDLTSQQCTNCLMSAAQRLPICCNSSTGARIMWPSCNIRYDTTRFYNESRLLELAQNPAPPTSPTLATPSTPPTPGTPGGGNGNGNGKTHTTIIIVVSVSGCLILLTFVGFLLRKRRKQKRKEKPQSEAKDDNSFVESLQYDFDKVRVATNDFSEANKLGQGGFGPVYRGKLLNGREIAVKRLSSNSCQGDKEFKNEVKLLAMLQHKNLVRLIGFSMIRTEKLLLYEFLQNSSLDKFIFDPKKCLDLNWDRRFKIIRGIAKGLLYLHEDARIRIIHRDLKASNILLDEDMNPKIADFGTARLFVQDETRANTARVVGTFGYMPPEYALHGQFSVKSDVYSFGVLILEIISGQKNNCFRNEENGVDLLTRVAWKNWQEGTDSKVIDPILRGVSSIPRDILRCIHIGLLCVQQNAAERPTMASVILMLNRLSTTLPIPSEPAFFVANDYDLEDSVYV